MAQQMDDPPEGFPPPGWQDDLDNGIVVQTHCCTAQWWIDRYGPTVGPYARAFMCGPFGWNITCPGEGGDPE